MKCFDWIRKKREIQPDQSYRITESHVKTKLLDFLLKIDKIVKFQSSKVRCKIRETWPCWAISGLYVSLDDMRILQSAYVTILSNDENEFILDEFSVQNVQNYKLPLGSLAPEIHPFRPLEPLFVTCWSNTQWMKPPVRNKNILWVLY